MVTPTVALASAAWMPSMLTYSGAISTVVVYSPSGAFTVIPGYAFAGFIAQRSSIPQTMPIVNGLALQKTG